jgi:hypothetical protein
MKVFQSARRNDANNGRDSWQETPPIIHRQTLSKGGKISIYITSLRDIYTLSFFPLFFLIILPPPLPGALWIKLSPYRTGVYFSVPVLNKETERKKEMSSQADGNKRNRSEFTVDLIFLVAYAKRVSGR